MKKMFGILVLLGLLVSACAPQAAVAPDDPSVVKEEQVSPESDNKYSWSLNSYVDVSTTVYTVIVRVNDDIVNHTEVNGSGSAFMYGGYGSASMRIWQEGKGLLPVVVDSISPAVDYIPVGSMIILKTSDLKAMGLPNGATATFICNMDTEVLSPVQHSQVLTTDRLTKELDDCRMTTPVYIAPSGQ